MPNYRCFKYFFNIKKPRINRGDFQMASTRGFEPMTARLEGVCSIQLSYVDIAYFQLLIYISMNMR